MLTQGIFGRIDLAWWVTETGELLSFLAESKLVSQYIPEEGYRGVGGCLVLLLFLLSPSSLPPLGPRSL